MEGRFSSVVRAELEIGDFRGWAAEDAKISKTRTKFPGVDTSPALSLFEAQRVQELAGEGRPAEAGTPNPEEFIARLIPLVVLPCEGLRGLA